MGILGFGKVTKLEELSITDLKKERLTQEVKQDQLLHDSGKPKTNMTDFLKLPQNQDLAMGKSMLPLTRWKWRVKPKPEPNLNFKKSLQK